MNTMDGGQGYAGLSHVHRFGVTEVKFTLAHLRSLVISIMPGHFVEVHPEAILDFENT